MLLTPDTAEVTEGFTLAAGQACSMPESSVLGVLGFRGFRVQGFRV